MNKNTKMIMVKVHVLSHFNYCPLIWHFCGKGDIHKMEKIQERALRFVYDDYTSKYTDFLCTFGELPKEGPRNGSGNATNGLSPEYSINLVQYRHSQYSNRRPLDPRVNQENFGYGSFIFQAPSLWNSLPLNIRKAENFNTFKNLIKSWNGPQCRCSFCICNSNHHEDIDNLINDLVLDVDLYDRLTLRTLLVFIFKFYDVLGQPSIVFYIVVYDFCAKVYRH